MKANELMIGDWVQIDQITFKVVNLDAPNGEVHSERWVYDLERCSPIKITPEILEKIGFEKVYESGKSDESVFSIYNYSADLHIGIYFDEFRDNMPIIYLLDENTGCFPGYQQYDLVDCQYVHELQHVLRLYKIEKEIII